MVFAQFYQMSVMDTTKPIEACGDRAVIILDGRERMESQIEVSRSECVKRGYIGFMLYRGDSFTRAKPVTSLQRV